MRRNAPTTIVIALLLWLAVACTDEPVAPLSPGASLFNTSGTAVHDSVVPVFDSTWIVMLSRDSVADLHAEAAAVVGASGGELRQVYRALHGFSAKLPLNVAQALKQSGRVRAIGPNGWTIPTNHSVQSSAPWGIDRIDQRTLPLSGTFTYLHNGLGANVYILDTGVRRSHADISSRTLLAQDMYGGNGEDCGNHGTRVASVAGGITYGVAKGATIRVVKMMDCLNNRVETAVSAIDWVASNRINPAVANLSFSYADCGEPGSGGPVPEPVSQNCVESSNDALDAAVNNLVASGVTAVVSAGNNNKDACGVSPARAASAITVAAITSSDSRWASSNYGSCVDIFSPGDVIASASSESDVATVTGSGTSLAAPAVAGAAAIYLQRSPSASPTDIQNELIGSSTKGIVTSEGAYSPNRLLYATLVGQVTLDAPIYAYEEYATITSTLGGGLGGHSHYYVWDYQFCSNSDLPSDCDYTWYVLPSGWDVTSARVYVYARDYWVKVRVRIRFTETGSDVATQSVLIEGAGEGGGGGGV